MTTIDSKKIFVINGSGGVGKDTFVQFVSEFYCRLTNKQVINYSSVDEIKKIAKDIGWTGSKTERDRKFLCDLKLIVSEYNDLPFAAMRGKVEDILFLHIREPEEIKRAVQEFNAITILVKRDNILHITSNSADDQVFNYDYDIVIDNNGTEADLKEVANIFVTDVLQNKIRIRYIAKGRVLN